MDAVSRFLKTDAVRTGRGERATQRYKALVAAGLHSAIAALYPGLSAPQKQRLAEAHTELVRSKVLGSAESFAAALDAYVATLAGIAPPAPSKQDNEKGSKKRGKLL